MHALYDTELACSAALALTALVMSLGRRPVIALCGFAAALAGRAAAYTFPGHRDLWPCVTLFVLAAALLVLAVVFGMLGNGRGAAHDPATCPGCAWSRATSQEEA